MASIRKMCFNDLLAMNHILMANNRQIATTLRDSTYGSLLDEILRNPDYALVAVSPSNQILGLSIHGGGRETICYITGIFNEDLGLPEIGDMLIQTIVEKADKIDDVYFVEVDVPLNNKRCLNFFGKHGFTWDGKQSKGSSRRLRKDLNKIFVNTWSEPTTIY
ncbi:uncharacterized protein LOC113340249 isoform X2 [Papaver somniferum]|uniref:uncharacterized protein LOC113340249 isoform X2 n=1 Tax=Papaver somniferum TaxID=3469 RepID=UPI000E70173F|nr:uncharacterized protein LOC113340249 isoform X2 [Papaver somniferum]